MRVLQMLFAISAAASSGAPTKGSPITQPQLFKLGSALLIKDRDAHLMVWLQSSGDVAYEYTGSQRVDGMRYYGGIAKSRVDAAQAAIQRLQKESPLEPPPRPKKCAAPHATASHAYLEPWNSRRIALESDWKCGDGPWLNPSPDAKIARELIDAVFTEVEASVLSKK